MGLMDRNHSCWEVPSGRSRGEPVLCPLQPLQATCLPWLMAFPSIFKVSNCITATSAFVILFFSDSLLSPSWIRRRITHVIHWATQIIQDYASPIQRLLITSKEPLLPYKVTCSFQELGHSWGGAIVCLPQVGVVTSILKMSEYIQRCWANFPRPTQLVKG